MYDVDIEQKLSAEKFNSCWLIPDKKRRRMCSIIRAVSKASEKIESIAFDHFKAAANILREALDPTRLCKLFGG